MGVMALDAVEYDKALPVGSFQLLAVSRVIIHPNRQVGRREVVFHLDVERCRRNSRRRCAGYFRGGRWVRASEPGFESSFPIGISAVATGGGAAGAKGTLGTGVAADKVFQA